MERRALSDAVLLDLVGEVMSMLELDELRRYVLDALLEVVPAKWASLNEMSGEEVLYTLVQPHLDDEWLVKFAEFGHENPIYRYYVRTGDGRPTRFSDVTTRGELERTTLFQRVYRPLGIQHQIAFTLPSTAPKRVMAVVLSREGRDFSDAERSFLDRARPFLVQAYRNAVDYPSGRGDAVATLETGLLRAGLTPRQAAVVRLVALGGSNRDVAAKLGLSARTVQKHLEHAFDKLGVSTRSAASAAAWSLADAEVGSRALNER